MQQTPTLVVINTDDLLQLVETAIRNVQNEQLQNSQYLHEDKPLSINEASDFLDIPKNTLYSYTSARKIPHKKMGRKIIFFKSELRAWLEEGKKKTRTQLESEGFKTKGGSK